MKIIKANISQLDTASKIVRDSINAVYPRYYTEAEVRFFTEWHNAESIAADINAGRVYLLESDGEPVGTITAVGCHITRLFVLPERQRRGYGKVLMDFAEELIADEYDVIKLDSSLPALEMYKKRGYIINRLADYDYGDGVLRYPEMSKNISLDGKKEADTDE